MSRQSADQSEYLVAGIYPKFKGRQRAPDLTIVSGRAVGREQATLSVRIGAIDRSGDILKR
jgi:hypothetical protein